MALFTRIARLFRADVHYLLDCVEDPEAMLKQAIREMEAEVARDEKSLTEIGSRMQRITAERKEHEGSLGKLEESVGASFEAGEEKLAKTFIRRRLEAVRRIAAIEEELSQLAADEKRIAEKLSERREKIVQISAKAKLFEQARVDQRRRKEDLLRFTSRAPSAAISEEEVELVFLKEKKARIGNDSGANAGR